MINDLKKSILQDIQEQAIIAFRKAQSRLLEVDDTQLNILDDHLGKNRITKKNLNNFCEKTYNISSSDNYNVASTQLSYGGLFLDVEMFRAGIFKSPHSFEVGYGFGALSEDTQEKVMLHEIGHVLCDHHDYMVSKENIRAKILKEKTHKVLCLAGGLAAIGLYTPSLTLLGLNFGVKFNNTLNLHKNEKEADFFSDVLMPELSYKEINNEVNNFVLEFIEPITHKNLFKFQRNYCNTLEYKNNFLGKMTGAYELMFEKAKSYITHQTHPSDINRVKKSEERCAAILNGETKLKL